MGKCEHDGIKQHAKRIFLEINGHPFHNTDASMFFAKILYMHFVMGEPVDFASGETHVNTHDIREETVSFTRRKLALALKEAGLELAQAKESLEAKLTQKEREVMNLPQAQAPHPANLNFED